MWPWLFQPQQSHGFCACMEHSRKIISLTCIITSLQQERDVTGLLPINDSTVSKLLWHRWCTTGVYGAPGHPSSAKLSKSAAWLHGEKGRHFNGHMIDTTEVGLFCHPEKPRESYPARLWFNASASNQRNRSVAEC